MKKLLASIPLLLLAACADDNRCDPQSSIPCDWLDDEENSCMPAPSSCRRSLPDYANLVIHVSQPLPVQVRVYSGTAYETGSLVWSGVPSGTSWSFPLPLGEYSVTALYVNDGDSVLAVDGNTVGYDAESYCEGTCYAPSDGEVDLRLD